MKQHFNYIYTKGAKKMRKGIFSCRILLVVILVIVMSFGWVLNLPYNNSLYASAATAPKEVDEISAALDAGLITTQIAGRMDSKLSRKDLCYMLDRLLEKKLGAKVEDILKNEDIILKSYDRSGTYGSKGQLDLSKKTLHTVYNVTNKDLILNGHPDYGYIDLNIPGLKQMLKDYSTFRKSAGSEGINRQETAELIWQIARMIGFDRDNYEQDFVNYGGYRWEDSGNYAVYFASGTVDKNGNRIMTAGMHNDTKVYFLPQEQTTTEDGIKAVYRLYNSEPPKLLSLEDIPVLSISKEMQSYINKSTLPQASYNNLPYWAGVNLTGKDLINDASENNGSTIHVYSENQIRYLSEMGFNCVRAMIGYRMISSYYDEEMIIEQQLNNIDDLIKWGAKYNVHIMLDMHVLPGWGCSTNGVLIRDIASDKNEQELALRYWKMFAKRYQNIPNNILSFNLFNEPYPVDDDKDGVFIGDEVFWEGFISKLTEGIKSIDSDRLIITDSYLHRVPFKGLQDDKIAQSVHIYDPQLLCSNTYAGVPPLKYQGTWPIPIIDNLVYSKVDSKYIPLTIKGDFPAGTKVSVEVNSIFTDGGKVEFALDLDGSAANVVKSESVSSNYVGTIDITTKVDAKSFVLYANPIGGGYANFSMKNLAITKPNGKITDFYVTGLPYGSEHGDTRGHTLTVNNDGSYTSDSYIGNDAARGIEDAWYSYIFDDFLKLRTSATDKVDFLCGEFGIISYTKEEYALKAYDTLLSYLQKNKIGWQVFAMTTNYGFLYDGYKDTVIQEGYPCNKARLQVLQRYMSATPIKEEVKGIKINNSKLQLKVGDTYQLKASVSNAKTASNPRIGWFTSNRSVVAVDSEGKLKVVGGGTATITAEAVDGSGVSASCVITVQEEARKTLKVYSYSSKDNLNDGTNAKSLGLYKSFEDIKVAMDKAKDKKAYYKIIVGDNRNENQITFSSYAKEIMICGKVLGWNDNEVCNNYTSIAVASKISANSEVIFKDIELKSQKPDGVIAYYGNGYKTTLYQCVITAKAFDGNGIKGKTDIQIKEFTRVSGEFRNIYHLTIGIGINVEVDKYNCLKGDTYKYEVAILRVDGDLKQIERLSSYEGRLALTASSKATFKNIDGVMLFIYMGKSNKLSEVTFQGQLSMYHGLKLVPIDNTYINVIYKAEPISLGNGYKLATISPRVTKDSLMKIGVPQNCKDWNDIPITLSGDELLVGKVATYKISFDTNGGGKPLDPKSVAYGGTYGELLPAERSGYVFKGWYTNAAKGSLITATTLFKQKADQTLYAHWEKAKAGK